MDTNQLAQKHQNEWQQVLQKQRQEKDVLRNRIAQTRQTLNTLTGILDRREKEHELAQLQQQLSALVQGHEQQNDSIKLRHQCEPIVISLLMQAAYKAGLQKSNAYSYQETYQETYQKPYTKETGLIFKKRVTEYKTEYRNETRAVTINLQIPLDVAEESPGRWAIGGKLADNSGYFMIIRVHLNNNQYIVFAESIWNYGAGYKNDTHDTRDLTETDLADALLSVLKGFQKQPPPPYIPPSNDSYSYY